MSNAVGQDEGAATHLVMTGNSRPGGVVWAGLLVLLALLFFDRLTFSDLVLARGDTFAYFYPYWEARSAALMAGRLPLWSPDLFMGVPLLANSQLGTFYPPNWIVAPLSAPQGVRLSILAHVAWALIGTYALARRVAALDRIPALLTAVVFAFSGYLGGRIEQINQLQGLSWLPWALLLLQLAPRRPPLYTPLLGVVLALQVFTGHTQTVFITVVGLGLSALVELFGRRGLRYADAMVGDAPSVSKAAAPLLQSPHLRRLLLLMLAGLVALLLALPQLLPTLELTGISHRGGGLNPNEATAFSLNPFLAARGMLPSYDLPIFAEYIAYPGIVALGLAIVGVIAGRGARPGVPAGAVVPKQSADSNGTGHPRIAWVLLAIVGLFFALGQYNPVYSWLAELPGFNLFRVPARWLILFSLGTAVLAGIGLQALPTLRTRMRWVAGGVTLAVVTTLASGAWLLTARNPEPVPATPPELGTLLGWGAALAVFLGLLVVVKRAGAAETQQTPREDSKTPQAPLRFRHVLVLPLAVVVLELWMAARALPYNQLVPPEVVNGQRFSISQMRVYAERDTPPGRLLSISNLLFDPGDRAALEARYAALGMSAAEVRTALVALKMQEVVAANLPLLWGIPSIDGFDGGVLPTTWYSAFASLLTPPNTLRTVDGRLREMLAREDCGGACIPDARWLALTNTRYLLIDKVYDLWHDDVAYDTGIRVSLAANAVTMVTPAPFKATAIDVLLEGGAPTLTLVLEDAREITLDGLPHWDADAARRVWRYTLPTPAVPVALRLRADAPLTLHALTLVDTRARVFQQVTLGDWRRILSSDIKIYENLAVLPRAFVVHEALIVRDDYLGTEDALALMRDPTFDPARTVVLATEETLRPDDRAPGRGGSPEAVRFTTYDATRLEISVASEAAGYLVVSDAYEAGWRATVNGIEVPIARANVMFRAVPIPPGENVVIMEYRPAWLAWLPWVALLWGVVLTVTLAYWRALLRM